MALPSSRSGKSVGLGLAFFALLAGSTVLDAASREIKGEALQEALSGNTAIGDWKGRAYRQFFAENGRTLYQEEDGPLTTGSWKIDSQNGRYCSLWSFGSWACYRVLQEGKVYYFQADGDAPQPFEIENGNRL